MEYILSLLAIAVAAYWYLRVHRKKVLLDKMLAGVEVVYVAIYALLQIRYERRMSPESAGLLAAAVTNELFSQEPGNEDGRQFLKTSHDKVQQELLRLQSDHEVREVLTQAIRVKGIVAATRGASVQASLIDPSDKLVELGLFVEGGEAPSIETFLPLAHNFYQSVMAQRANAENGS